MKTQKKLRTPKRKWKPSPPKHSTAKGAPLRWLMLAWGALLLAACTRSSLPPGTDPFIPPTISENSTPLVLETATSLPATATPPCDNHMVFLQDLTVPDGSHFSPGETIDKVWQVRNEGSCVWTSGYTIQLEEGRPLGFVDRHPLPPANPGDTVNIEVEFRAPEEPGNYRSSWRATDLGGEPFGVLIYIDIVVD